MQSGDKSKGGAMQKLTESQRAYFVANWPKDKEYIWESDFCTPYMGKKFAELGLVRHLRQLRPGRTTALMQLRITDAGRAALRGES